MSDTANFCNMCGQRLSVPQPEPVAVQPEFVPQPEPVQVQPEFVPQPEPVQEQPEFVPQPEPVQEQPEFVPQPEPVQEQPEFVPQPESVQEQPEFVPQPEPVQEQPEFVPQPEPVAVQPEFVPQPESDVLISQAQQPQYAPQNNEYMQQTQQQYPPQNNGYAQPMQAISNMPQQQPEGYYDGGVMPEVVRKKKKKSPKGKKKTGLVAIIAASVIAVVVLIAVIVVAVLGFTGKEKQGTDISKMPVFFRTRNNEINFVSKESNDVKSSGFENLGNLKVSHDGEIMMYGVGGSEFDLYYRNTKSKDSENVQVLIDEDVSEYEMSKDGSAVFYIKDDSIYRSNLKESTEYGKDVYDYVIDEAFKNVLFKNFDDELYFSDGRNEKLLDVDASAFGFVEDCDKVYWIANYDELYISETSKKASKQLVDDDVDEFIFLNGGKEVYYTKNDDLYYKSGKKSIKLLSDVYYIESCENTDGKHEYLAFDDDDGMYLLEGKKAIKLCDEYYNNLDENYRLICVYDDDDYEKEYYYRVGKKLHEVDMPENYSSLILGEKYVYYIDGVDNLMRCKIGFMGFDADRATVLAEDVGSYTFNVDNEKITYVWKNDNSLGIYDGKYREVCKNVQQLMYVEDKNMIFTQDDSGSASTICSFNGRKTTEISDNVVQNVVCAKDRIYYLTEDKELYISNGKKSTLISEDVVQLYPLWMYVQF